MSRYIVKGIYLEKTKINSNLRPREYYVILKRQILSNRINIGSSR